MSLDLRVGRERDCGTSPQALHQSVPILPSTGGLQAGLFSVLALAVCLLTSCKENKPPPPSPPEVQVITVEPRDVPIYKEWIGTLDGLVNATIRAQVVGYLLRQDYVEGSTVKKGDLLFQ